MAESDRSADSREDRKAPRGIGRLFAAVQNGLEIARFGGLGEPEPSPHEIAAEGAHHRLRHYFPDTGSSGRPAVLLVPPLMLTAEIWDVAPESSGVAMLYQRGADPWVVDFGSPEEEQGGLARTLTDHVLAVSEAIDSVREATGRDVHLMGYSQGGMFAYQCAAYRRSDGIASLVTFGSPVDLHGGLPGNLSADFVADTLERLGKLQSWLAPSGIPSWATRLGFQLMDPIKTAQQKVDFARRLYDREALQQREGMRRFMDGEGWVAFPGPALRDVIEQLVAHNRMLQGGFVIDERTVSLADLTCPILAFVGTSDSIAPPNTVRPIAAAAPRADCYQAKLAAGHFALVVGSRASEVTWPTVAEWLDYCAGSGPLPEQATPLEVRPESEQQRTTAETAVATASYAWNLGRGLVSDAVELIGDRAGLIGRLTNNVATQIPRLTRLAEIRSDTPVSLGRALEERAAESPDDTFFLFEGRAHSYQAANIRIDNIVRGLLACGVRHGDHVGLLMETRPSAVAAAVALSRLGAVAVMLRPDIPLPVQTERVPVEHLLCDPEHAEAAHDLLGREVLVLGGGGERRTLAPGLVDMEAIDPDRVPIPSWYSPNPGTAGELALVLITGDADRIGVSRVTNRRWATSAYGTASGCALTSRDTVYCCSPAHHATGILVCVGGALVSGARLAMATRFAPSVDPVLFWEDVRRYGVNVVFYTGSLCRVLVNSPESPDERHHPLRLFAGSGMPAGIWKRVIERFAPARVVEFFASSEGNAVLVNLTGEKIGSLGQPLPGAAELALAAWDLPRGRLEEGEGGFSRRCAHGEVGLLIARVDPQRGEVEGRPLRGVFEAGDAWLNTGDLVRLDDEGDYWLIDETQDVIRTARGPVATIPLERVLATEIDFVDLAAVYGVRVPGLSAEIPVAAITLRPGSKLDPRRLREDVAAQLSQPERPLVVRVLEELPMTAGHRTRKRSLRIEGLGLSSAHGESFWMKPGTDAYVPLENEDVAALIASVDPL